LRIKMEAGAPVSEPIAKTAEAEVPAVAVTEAVSEPVTQNAEAEVPAPVAAEEVVSEAVAEAPAEGTEN